MQTSCDYCAYNEYDEEDEEYYCSVNMDEDDLRVLYKAIIKSVLTLRTGMNIVWFATRCKFTVSL